MPLRRSGRESKRERGWEVDVERAAGGGGGGGGGIE